MNLSVWQVDPAHLTPYYDKALCSALAQLGCPVRFFTSRYLYEPPLPHTQGYVQEYVYFRKLTHHRLLAYPLLRRCLRALSYPFDHRAFLQQARLDRPDVIHFQWLHMPRIDLRLIHQLKQLGIGIVYTVHDVDNLFEYKQMRGYEQIYAEVDKIIVHAQANRRLFLQQYPSVPSEKVEVIPHLEVSFETPNGAEREQARDLLRIPNHAQVCLFFGTIRAYKGLDILIEAFVRARITHPNLWIVIAGRSSDPQMEQHLKQLADHAIVHLAYVPTQQVWQYQLAADLAVFPYRRVSQSGALITAMSYGLPVIVSDVGGLPETIDGNGWVVPSGDATALADALINAVSEPVRLHEMGRRSRELIHQRHSPADVAVRLHTIYREVVIETHPLLHR